MMRFFKPFRVKHGKANGPRFCVILVVQNIHFDGLPNPHQKINDQFAPMCTLEILATTVIFWHVAKTT